MDPFSPLPPQTSSSPFGRPHGSHLSSGRFFLHPSNRNRASLPFITRPNLSCGASLASASSATAIPGSHPALRRETYLRTPGSLLLGGTLPQPATGTDRPQCRTLTFIYATQGSSMGAQSRLKWDAVSSTLGPTQSPLRIATPRSAPPFKPHSSSPSLLGYPHHVPQLRRSPELLQGQLRNHPRRSQMLSNVQRKERGRLASSPRTSPHGRSGRPPLFLRFVPLIPLQQVSRNTRRQNPSLRVV